MKVTAASIVVFLILAVAFFAWFGGPPTFPGDFSMTHGMRRSWLYCSLLFLAGAGTACFGDKQYGLFPPTSLRWLFILVGVFIMVVSAAWMHGIAKASAFPSYTRSQQRPRS